MTKIIIDLSMGFGQAQSVRVSVNIIIVQHYLMT